MVGNTIKLKRKGGLLTTADSPHKAWIVAGRDLSSSMLRVLGVDDFEISFIKFDGNRDARAVRDKSCAGRRNFRNVELMGNGFSVRYIESSDAACGSALTIGDSSNFRSMAASFSATAGSPRTRTGSPAYGPTA